MQEMMLRDNTQPETKLPERKLSLRELTEELTAWRDTLEGSGEDEADIGFIRAKLAQIEAMHEDKTDRFCAFLRWLAAEQVSLGADALRFQSRKKAYERLEARRRADVVQLMMNSGITQLRGRCSRVDWCAGKLRPEVYDPAAVPAEYLEQVEELVIPAHTKPDLARIGEALLAGKDVPGARLKEGAAYIRVS